MYRWVFLFIGLCFLSTHVGFPVEADAKRRSRRKRARKKNPPKKVETPVVPKETPKQLMERVNKERLTKLLGRTLIIGTKISPPFTFKNSDGTWSGISIELWKELAAQLRIKFKFKEYDLKGLVKSVAEGKVDAAVASLTITPKREAQFDFTHPFYTTGLGMAIRSDRTSGWFNIAKQLFSYQFMKFLFVLFMVLLITGLLVWWFEKSHNHEEFGGGVVRGIGAGFWWSAVTMTTVGYGDKSPRTLGGRIVALIWIFTSLILVSSFTAALTSLLTVGQLQSDIKGPQDLHRLRVATVPGSTSNEYLRQKYIKWSGYKNVVLGMRALADKKVDAMVYDAPILFYIANNELKGQVLVLPNTFMRQDYGIGLPSESPLREPLNRAILRVIYSNQWRSILKRYLGK